MAIQVTNTATNSVFKLSLTHSFKAIFSKLQKFKILCLMNQKHFSQSAPVPVPESLRNLLQGLLVVNVTVKD
jgi:hypothetical protein